MINFYETIVNSSLTDHFTLQFSMNFNYKTETKEEKATNPYSTKIYEYNTRDADDEDWEKFEAILDALDYEKRANNKNVEEKLNIMLKMFEETTDIMMEKKKEFSDEAENEDGDERPDTRNFITKKVRKLMRRKKKLTSKMFTSKLWQKNAKIEEELEAVEHEIDEH